MVLASTRTKLSGLDPIDLLDESVHEILQGMQRKQKTLPSKYFYDEKGSQLFDQICGIDEYYLTRTETAIMQENIQEISNLIRSNSLLIEFGSGSSIKTRLLLDKLPDLKAYIPVDISNEQLNKSCSDLEITYPDLQIHPIYSDFTKPFTLPNINFPYTHTTAYFPGSTLGNFHLGSAVKFMSGVAEMVGVGGGFIIGIDMQKDPEVIYSAYNDRNGITAEFNLNILTHINRDFHTNFEEDQFIHQAFYNQSKGRIEMHLVSKCEQRVNLNGSLIHIAEGESILTEVSYKYSEEGFADIYRLAGFREIDVWRDPKNMFSVYYLESK